MIGVAKTGAPGEGTMIAPLMVLTVGDARLAAAWTLPVLSTADVFAVLYWRRHAEARQLVSHKHIAVNGRTVNSSSYLVKAGDVVEVRHKNLPSVINALESVVRRGIPAWIDLDKDNMKGTIKLFPTRDDITLPIKEQLIVEYYSR